MLVPASVSEGGIPCVCAPPKRRSRYLVTTYSDYETIAGAFSERNALKLSSMDNSHFFVYLSAFLPLFALLTIQGCGSDAFYPSFPCSRIIGTWFGDRYDDVRYGSHYNSCPFSTFMHKSRGDVALCSCLVTLITVSQTSLQLIDDVLPTSFK